MNRKSVPRISVLLVDDHALMRAGLRMIIESDPQLSVIGEAENRIEALKGARKVPDIILLDLALAEESSLDFLPELLEQAKGSRVIIVTGLNEPAVHHRAVRLGAMGVVHKSETPKTLITAIKKVYAGDVWLNPAILAHVLDEFQERRQNVEVDPEAEKIAKLSKRERDIIAFIGEGLRNKEISERLFVSEPTVRHNLGVIFSKLGVSDRLKLMAYAHRHRLLNPNGTPSQ